MWGRLQRRRRLGRFERKCAPETLEIRPCKPLEINGGTDEPAAGFRPATTDSCLSTYSANLSRVWVATEDCVMCLPSANTRRTELVVAPSLQGPRSVALPFEGDRIC